MATNGIQADATLADDAVYKLRKYVEKYESADGDVGTRGKRLLQIADMVDRDYMRREHYYNRVSELGAERDEWKAKAEQCNPCGWWNASLQYCERNDGEMPENGVSADDVDANDGNAMQDTREKLEADVSKYVHDAWAQGWEAGQHDDMDCCNFYVSDMRALLDRQAAITKAEQRDWWGGVVAELQAKVDELTAERDHWLRMYEQICRALDDVVRNYSVVDADGEAVDWGLA